MEAPNDYAIITSGLTKTYKSKKGNAEQYALFFRQKSRNVKAVDQLNLEIRRVNCLVCWNETAGAKKP